MTRHALQNQEESPPSTEWLTTAEVASLLRVHPKHVYRLLKEGMPARRVGGQWRFSRGAIQTWAEQRGEAASPTGPEPEPNSPTPTTRVAIEPNEVSDAVAAVLGETSAAAVGVVFARSRSAMDLLCDGGVVAAVVRCEDASEADFATVRIHLGARQIGLLGRSDRAIQSVPKVVAVAKAQPARGALGAWLESAALRGAIIQTTDSELEACSRVLRQEVDLAVGSRGWGKRLALRFQALASEPWELVIRVGAMDSPCASSLCIAAQSEDMRTKLAQVLAGDIESVGQMRVAPSAGQSARPTGEDAPEPPHRCASKSRRAVRWTLLRRQRAEQMLHLVEALRRRGLRVGGFLQLPAGPASAKPLAYDLYRLAKSERIPFAERIARDRSHPAGERFCELAFHAGSVARAWEWLRQDAATSDLLVIDGVGGLENRGKGFFPALAWVRSLPHPKMIVLSSRHDDVPCVADRLALDDKQVASILAGAETATPELLADQVLKTCGRKSRAHAPSTGQG